MLINIIQLLLLTIFIPTFGMIPPNQIIRHAKQLKKIPINNISVKPLISFQCPPTSDLVITILENKMIKLYKKGQDAEIINLFKNYENKLASGKISKIESPKAYDAKEHILDIFYCMAQKGNLNAQKIILERFIDRLLHIKEIKQYLANNLKENSNYDQDWKNIQKKSISCNFGLLDFLVDLSTRNKSFFSSTDINKKIINCKNSTIDLPSYILCTCRFLQSITNLEKERTANIILTEKCPNDDLAIQEICLFLANYADSELSINDAVKKFIKNLNEYTNISEILFNITQEQIFYSIINKLKQATLSTDDPDFSHLNIILAELYYHNNEFDKADKYFSIMNTNTIIYNAINPEAYKHAVIAHLNNKTNTQFTQENIKYLSGLITETHTTNYHLALNDFLLIIQQKNPYLSYKIGLLIYKLTKENNLKQKYLLNGLHHLAYAQKKGDWNDANLETIRTLTIKLHMILSDSYDMKDNKSDALKHLLCAIDHNKAHDTQDNALKEILSAAQQKHPDFYNKNASLILTILKQIKNQPQKKNLNEDFTPLELLEFIQSYLCTQLIPHCEEAYKTNKKNKHETILCLMALYHKSKKNYVIAQYYIDQLPQPILQKMLLLKAEIYTHRKKSLPFSEFNIILNKCLKNKNKFSKKYNAISSMALLTKDFFVASPENYKNALALIQECCSLPKIPLSIIELAHYINNYFITHNNSYFYTWIKELNTFVFYDKLDDASLYDESINFMIAELLFHQVTTPDNYKKTISHFTAALNKQKITPEQIFRINQCCGELYYKWALAIKEEDDEQYKKFIGIATSDYNNASAWNEKAYILFLNSENLEQIQYAQKLLENNIEKDSSTKNIASFYLGVRYLCFCHDTKIFQKLYKFIQIDIKKAIEYLEQSTHAGAIQLLTSLYSGTLSLLSPTLTNEYIDFKKAISSSTYLINNNHNREYNLLIRKMLHCKCNEPENVLKDIDILINEFYTEKNKINLLSEKITVIQRCLIKDNNYSEVLACLKELQSIYMQQYKYIPDPLLIPHIKETILTIINNKINTPSAIDLCCYVAHQEALRLRYKDVQIITDYQEKLSDYLIAAATQCNLVNCTHTRCSASEHCNINAQLVFLPYLFALQKINAEDDQTTFERYLSYAHSALIKTKESPLIMSDIKHPYCTTLINVMHSLTKQGIANGFYILCDYYKENENNKLEEILKLFSQVKQQRHVENDRFNMMKNITSSCLKILEPHATTYINCPEISTRFNLLATFTLACIYRLSDEKSLLNHAIHYLTTILSSLQNKKNSDLKHLHATIASLLEKTKSKQIDTVLKLKKKLTHNDTDKNKIISNIIKNNYDNLKYHKALIENINNNKEIDPDDYIILALYYLADRTTKKNITESYKYLLQALKTGIYSSKTNPNMYKMHDIKFVNFLFSYIHNAINLSSANKLFLYNKKMLLSAIHHELKDKKISMSLFYECFKEETAIDLTTQPDWQNLSVEYTTTTTEKNKTNTTNQMNNKNRQNKKKK